VEIVRKLTLISGVLLIASCGRWGFSQQPPAIDDATPAVDATPLQNALVCGQPQRFQIGAAGIDQLTATPTHAGYSLFTVDTTGNLAGWSYEWQEAGLVAAAENVALDSDVATTVGATDVGSDLVVAAIHGASSATGTNVYPLAGDLTNRGPTAVHTEISGDTMPIAKSGVGNGLALVTVDAGFVVSARAITTFGEYAGNPVQVVDGTLRAGSISIEPAGTGYVMTWTEALSTPNALRIALLDASFAVVAGPFTQNTTGFDPARPHVVWASTSNVYLTAWHEKNVGGDDDVFIQLRDHDLNPITPATIIANFSHTPVIATDGTDFWVAWRTYTTMPDHLEAAHLTPTGTLTPRSVTSTSGATPKHYTMLERNGQAVMVYTETGGSGPDLWLDALCP
jgi:hypothetical protein